MTCFWTRGYEATSVRDLAASMGINGPSLYNAFGHKRALFGQALERYAECSMRQRIGRLEREYRSKAAIVHFFGGLIERSLDDKDRRGCLIVNSALDVAPHDKELRAVIAGYLGEIESFFQRCLVRAKSNGEVAATTNVKDTACLFLGVLLGIRVAARTKPDRALLAGMVRPALGLIGARLPMKAKAKKSPTLSTRRASLA